MCVCACTYIHIYIHTSIWSSTTCCSSTWNALSHHKNQADSAKILKESCHTHQHTNSSHHTSECIESLKVLRCVAVCYSVLQCVAVCCSVLQYVAVCCSVLRCVALCCSMLQYVALCCTVLQCVAVCCSVLLIPTCHTYECVVTYAWGLSHA